MRWLAQEVVQTSAMDCGPAALKCVLEGFNIPVSYGRLREACQTSVDGTSVDRLEEVANQLGVYAEQVMIPIDHILLSAADALPAMVVIRHPDGANHFVVIWSRHGTWLQLMDPAVGRRWVKCERFIEEVYRHELSVPIEDWFVWAQSDEYLLPLQQRLRLLGANKKQIAALLLQAEVDGEWFAYAKLDASVRLVSSIVTAGGIKTGKTAANLVQALVDKIDPDDIYRTIPINYWSVVPMPGETNDDLQLLLKGAVLLKFKSKETQTAHEVFEEELSPELEAALHEKQVSPFKTLLEMMQADGLLAPLTLVGALTISVAAVLLETLLFRGIFDVTWELKLATQRLGAMTGLITFVAVLMLIEIPIAIESMRFGRHLETRLRLALLRKLPQLSDRYFQSRPISDMAERSHSIATIKQVPDLGIHFLQTFWDIIFTLIGITLIDPASSSLAFLVTLLAIILPLVLQPMLNERDLRMRSHSAAMFSFYLDSLLGLVPIRTHRAEQAISREHEGLLVQWSKAGRKLVQLTLWLNTLQSLVCMLFVIYMLWEHFVRTGGVVGSDLLLVYWALKLPEVGHSLAGLAEQYPAQRNALLRLLEPLNAPEELDAQPSAAISPAALVRHPNATSIAINDGLVIAGGHTILQNVNVSFAPGEHVAIVGTSGAGKSTLVGLLLGWHKLASGELLVDGVRYSSAAATNLRKETAWVDPGIQIWNSTFQDNLSYSSSDVSFDRIANAIDAAALRGIVQKLPDGLQTYLGEGGALLSGGEGQRVRLGRALLQTDVRLVLLDEPFRGLDKSQRRKLLGDARKWWQQATLLCVTHDVEETLSFKRVLVIENGEIVEDGVPMELAIRPSRYRELVMAEKRVRQNLWQGNDWRRIEISQGLVKTTAEATNHE